MHVLQQIMLDEIWNFEGVTPIKGQNWEVSRISIFFKSKIAVRRVMFLTKIHTFVACSW